MLDNQTKMLDRPPPPLMLLEKKDLHSASLL